MTTRDYNGAGKYCELFPKPIQIDRLFLLPGEDGYEKTFSVFVLPLNVEIDIQNIPCCDDRNEKRWNKDRKITNSARHYLLDRNGVEVFGPKGGHVYYPHTHYVWLHKGVWCDELQKICVNRPTELHSQKKAEEAAQKRMKEVEGARIANLLATYE